MKTLKDPKSHIYLLLLYVLLKREVNESVKLVCFTFTTGFRGGRQSSSLLFLSFSFLFAPLILHCLLPCTSLSALPQAFSVNRQPSDSFLSFYSLT